MNQDFPAVATGSADPSEAGIVVNVTPLQGCRIQSGIGMFQGNLGLMADFFAAATGCDNRSQ